MSRIDSNEYILDLNNNSEKEKINKREINKLKYPTIEEFVAVSSVVQNIHCPINQDTNDQHRTMTVNTFRRKDLR